MIPQTNKKPCLENHRTTIYSSEEDSNSTNSNCSTDCDEDPKDKKRTTRTGSKITTSPGNILLVITVEVLDPTILSNSYDKELYLLLDATITTISERSRKKHFQDYSTQLKSYETIVDPQKRVLVWLESLKLLDNRSRCCALDLFKARTKQIRSYLESIKFPVDKISSILSLQKDAKVKRIKLKELLYQYEGFWTLKRKRYTQALPLVHRTLFEGMNSIGEEMFEAAVNKLDEECQRLLNLILIQYAFLGCYNYDPQFFYITKKNAVQLE